jgi:hypothetical protein
MLTATGVHTKHILRPKVSYGHRKQTAEQKDKSKDSSFNSVAELPSKLA